MIKEGDKVPYYEGVEKVKTRWPENLIKKDKV